MKRRITALGSRDVETTPASPWENTYVERVIGSIRRECLDRIIVLNERHLRRVRETEHREEGNVVALPFLGGLHHRYMHLAARCRSHFWDEQGSVRKQSNIHRQFFSSI